MADTAGIASKISIHAPREGSDCYRRRTPGAGRNFNPRSPRGERHPALWGDVYLSAFQSTLPARGATSTLPVPTDVMTISIHAPREGSDEQITYVPIVDNISIHAPREGSDEDLRDFAAVRVYISIHAPREGSDGTKAPYKRIKKYFNPRSPRGEPRL